MVSLFNSFTIVSINNMVDWSQQIEKMVADGRDGGEYDRVSGRLANAVLNFIEGKGTRREDIQLLTSEIYPNSPNTRAKCATQIQELFNKRHQLPRPTQITLSAPRFVYKTCPLSE